MSNLRIVFVVNSLSKGGAERVLSILANKFQSSKYQVDLIYFRNIPIKYPIDKAINLHCLNAKFELSNNPLKRIYTFLKKSFSLRKALKKIPNKKVVISFGDAVSSSLIVSEFFSFFKTNTIVSIRSNPLKNSISLHRKIALFLYIFCSKIVVQSEFIKKSIHSYFLKEKTVKIFNPVQLNLDKNPYDLHNHKYTILSIGRYVRSKRHDILIHAFHRLLKKRNENLQLCIAGKDDGEKEQLQKLVDDLNISKNVTLLDAIDDVYSLYLNSKIYVHPSEYEGMSNAVLEAMSAGLPCIISNYDGIEEIISHNDNGYLFETNDIDSLTYLMDQLIDNKEKKLDFSDRSFNLINEQFNVNLIYKKWENLVLDLDT